jgi:2,3-bisphosphoglycerate-independent phosphoglycerate mutase
LTRLLFLFLDGVGLGENDLTRNPLARARMPHVEAILDGCRLVRGCAPTRSRRATLLGLDAGFGIPGLPQSATGQAALLTGQNIPALLGYHYGPKPNPSVAEVLRNGNLFSRLRGLGRSVSFLNAYPAGYFKGISTGHRLYSAIPLAVTSAGLPLKDEADLASGRALSADFTGQGWREHLGYPDSPLLTPFEAGQRMAALAAQADFAFFEYWLSDYAGHRQNMDEAVSLLETLDQVLGGLFTDWDDGAGLILVTSDHGNLEDLSTRRHTLNEVPALVVGEAGLRDEFCSRLTRLDDVAPAVLRLLNPS